MSGQQLLGYLPCSGGPDEQRARRPANSRASHLFMQQTPEFVSLIREERNRILLSTFLLHCKLCSGVFFRAVIASDEG